VSVAGTDAIVREALALSGLSYGASRDAYCTALYPLDLPAQARQMGAAQSACGLVCEAVLRKARVDGTCRFRGVLRDWLELPYAARVGTAVALQEQIARERGQWVDARIDQALPGVGDMVTVVGPEHVLTIVDALGGGVFETVEGGQIDQLNGGHCTAIRRLRRVMRQRDGAWWLASAESGAGPGRRVRGWMHAAQLPQRGGVVDVVADTEPVPASLDLSSVRGWQHALIAMGYDLGASGADGIVGPRTREAVRAFQARHGLAVDGIVGPRTREAMARELARP
jgi:hypothetical protein